MAKRRKYMIISVPNEIFSEVLGSYISDTLKFKLSSTGCGSTEYEGYGFIDKVCEKLIDEFGRRTLHFLNIANMKDVT